MNKLFLIDGMAVIYRAHFALSKNPRINSKGFNTSVILGFTNSLLEIINKQKPTHLAVSFDTSKPTFRHAYFEEYKANRDHQPEVISQSFQPILDLLNAFQIPVFMKDGFEADDIIGTIAKKAAKENFDTYMMTNDKDYSQLVEKHIFMYKMPFMGSSYQILGEKEILEKWEIKRVDQVIDILSLQGDAVDNVPGVPSIGKKTATKLIEKFDTLENILANTKQLKGKQRENLETFSEQALLSKRLVTIKLDVDIDVNFESLIYKGFIKKKLEGLFEEWEFRTLSKKLFKKETKKSAKSLLFKSIHKKPTVELLTESSGLQKNKDTISTVVKNYHILRSPKEIADLVEFLNLQKAFAFDTETTSLKAFDSSLVGISCAYQAHEAFYIPVPEDMEAVKALLKPLKALFENPTILKIGQNIKYDEIILKHYNIHVKGAIFDTMLAHYMLAPDRPHNLDALAAHYLNYQTISIETLIGKKGKTQKSMREVPLQSISSYACEDVDITFQLKIILEHELNKDIYSDLLEKIEYPLVEVLTEMEYNGVCIDKNFLENYDLELQKELNILEEKVYQEAGCRFNLASPKQLGKVLFETLALEEKPKKTATGQYATGEKILMRLEAKHQIVKDILAIRALQKLHSNYTTALVKLVSPKDNLIHTSYNQAVAVTGRLSSTNPNLQNIPIRTSQGQKIRQAFISRSSDYILLSADYSQVELRFMAHFSQDETMINAFEEGLDIHTITASRIYKVDIKNVTSEMRRHAKTANFGIIYGISAFGLSERLYIPRSEAKQIIDSYFEEFPKIKTYMAKSIEFAVEHGFVETLVGRKRYLPDIHSRNHIARSNAERNAINSPIQGSAADLIKIAMINSHDYLKKNQLQSKMIMQVHDELIFDVYKPELKQLQTEVNKLMVEALHLKVPLVVDIGLGENWLKAH